MVSQPIKELLACVGKDTWRFFKRAALKRPFDRILARKGFLKPRWASMFLPIKVVHEVPQEEIRVKECFHSTSGEVILRKSYRFPKEQAFSLEAADQVIKIGESPRFSFGKFSLLDLGNQAENTFDVRRTPTVLAQSLSVDRLAVPWAKGGCSYGDFIIQVLPLVHNLCQLESGRSMVGESLLLHGVGQTPWSREFLALLSIPLERVVPEGVCLRLERGGRLRFTSGISGPASIAHPQYLLALRRNVLSAIGGRHVPEFPRVYISRKGGRVMSNELELLPGLHERGFHIVRLEELSVIEQILLFSQAKIVVGPHGAGHANILWSQPGTVLFEVFHPAWKHPCYSILASLVGASYHYMMSGAINFKGHWNQRSRSGMTLNVEAPPDAFFRVIDRLLESSGQSSDTA